MIESVKQFFFLFARVVAAMSPWLSSFVYAPHLTRTGEDLLPTSVSKMAGIPRAEAGRGGGVTCSLFLG
jgi:hypothetical protein